MCLIGLIPKGFSGRCSAEFYRESYGFLTTSVRFYVQGDAKVLNSTICGDIRMIRTFAALAQAQDER
jgi:hypothetical protein